MEQQVVHCMLCRSKYAFLNVTNLNIQSFIVFMFAYRSKTHLKYTKNSHCMYSIFYHGCNILTNQIAQKEVDKSLIKPTSYLSTCKCGAHAFSGWSNWVPAQQVS